MSDTHRAVDTKPFAATDALFSFSRKKPMMLKVEVLNGNTATSCSLNMITTKMKYMKLGTRPDTFYTEEATRTVISDEPCDLTISINNITYLLHKIPLVPKCGLLERLCSYSGESDNVALELHDIPGGENAFELCAKFCYGITINLSAHNFVYAFCAAKFLRMTETVEEGNFILKLEAFFNSCILEGWKDSIVTLQTTGKVPEWSENLGIIRRCVDSIVEKILKPPAKVTWSYTYTRPGYERKRHQSVPKDWWTEDISDLDLDLFRCIIAAARSSNMLQHQLIGEALHVYACRWVHHDSTSTESSATQTEQSVNNRKRQILETIVSMIPAEGGSVSFGFLLRLLRIANILGVSPVTKTELMRRSGQQFEEATLNELLLPSYPSDDCQYSYDIDLVGALLESFLRQWRRRSEERQSIRSIVKVGKLIDSYLQVIATDANMPVQKVVSIAATLPEIARPEHNELYRAINIYLKEHPDLTKEDKQQLCRTLDCQKLTPQVRSHVVRNERLPLRTVVQVIFHDQERGSRGKSPKFSSEELFRDRQQKPDSADDLSKLKLDPNKQFNKAEGARGTALGRSSEGIRRRLRKSEDKLQRDLKSSADRHEGEERKSEKGKEIGEEESAGRKLDPIKILRRRALSSHSIAIAKVEKDRPK